MAYKSIWEILGISPTSDIKTIKSAYSKLAKQNNPEEHPEEFQEINAAYRQAMEYARKHKSSASHSGDNTDNQELRRHSSEQDDADGYDFSGADTGRKKTENTARKKSDEFEFDINESREPQRQAEAERNEPDGYDFDSVDTSKNKSGSGVQKNSDGDEFEFDINSHSKDSSRLNRSEPEKDEGFDFSDVDTDYDPERKLTSLRISILRQLENMLKDNTSPDDYGLWENFYRNSGIEQIIWEYEFRCRAAKLFAVRRIPNNIAQLAVRVFGRGTRCIHTNSGNLWIVLISTGRTENRAVNRQPQSADSSYSDMYNGRTIVRKMNERVDISPKKTSVILIAAALFWIAVCSVMFKDGIPSSSGQGSYAQTEPEINGYYLGTDEDYNDDPAKLVLDAAVVALRDKEMTVEDLKPIFEGEWEFGFGTVIFNEDYSYTAVIDGVEYSGTSELKAAPKGPSLWIKLKSDNVLLDGMMIRLYWERIDKKTGTATDFDHFTYQGTYIGNNDAEDDTSE